ncbi:P-loop containing nucleoside triphosphate hydrolase protein [Conidiobolus coronatus NRRL 28638]|uniref:Nucleotide-binding protein-like n=1 Tax=Conidiobolus coronatus (strain ATCC 28846 / CBS 209.66 / NRRL 28638) TaxID=796925 RepID=A0A137PCH2_CONC2|nr:P-loop containing nucleoside triphosphate hydrolase protein [Conidiobolus coronatus NRRL 28638]|eukprot:KXN72683.1 P-loop containing nucleoside triphosphate hydrolase protein [Conidiobolus coronatus NRRL 28638]
MTLNLIKNSSKLIIRNSCKIRSSLGLSRLLSTNTQLLHENPLGLPKRGPGGFGSYPPPARKDPKRGLPTKQPIPKVKHVICVASGKGGVGKSTTSINLAIALNRKKLKVGVLDADLFGPSIPKLLNLNGEPELNEKGHLLPLKNYGLASMSMGFLVPEGAPIVWRGLMVMKALQQLIYEVDWEGGLDVLVVDMPPGTGDVQLTLSQLVPISGSVIVTTPQDLALIDARKGVEMFKKVNIPVSHKTNQTPINSNNSKLLGIVQNMNLYTCPHCNKSSHVFGSNGGNRMAKEFDIDLLGDIPLDPKIMELSDSGTPITVMEPESKISLAYSEIADKVIEKLNLKQD